MIPQIEKRAFKDRRESGLAMGQKNLDGDSQGIDMNSKTYFMSDIEFFHRYHMFYLSTAD